MLLYGSGWGTGGLPGLQIQSVGVNSVHGRFDSYTLPPFIFKELRGSEREDICFKERFERLPQAAEQLWEPNQ